MIFSILRERIIEFDIKIFHRPLSKRVVTQRRGETFSKENKQSGDRKDEALEGENFIRERERARERSASRQKNATHIHHSIFLNLLTLLANEHSFLDLAIYY